MSIERLQQYYGFTRMPFGRGLAPAMLHRHPAHAEAVGEAVGELGVEACVLAAVVVRVLDLGEVVHLPVRVGHLAGGV